MLKTKEIKLNQYLFKPLMETDQKRDTENNKTCIIP